MGVHNSLCYCKCQDQLTEENLQKTNMTHNDRVISQTKTKVIKADFFLTRPRVPDLNQLKLNIASKKITKFLRESKFKLYYQNNFSQTFRNKLNTQRSTSSTGRITKQRIDFSEKHSQYIGSKYNNEKEGFGIQLWSGGGKYSGYFKNNKAEGYGLFISDGDVYLGEFSNDVAYGFGIYRHSNGASYTGYWTNDTQEPLGKEVWIDGSVYQGEYYQGKKHGIGVYKWPDQSVYEGQWKNNCLNGYGVYYFSNHRAYLGEWKNNEKEGFGEFVWQDKRYIGYYQNDKKDGFGIYYWKNVNKAFIGFWKKGRQDGFGKYMTANKKKYGLWKSENEIEWLKPEEDEYNYLDRVGLGSYRSFFNFSLEDIKTYFENRDDLNDELML